MPAGRKPIASSLDERDLELARRVAAAIHARLQWMDREEIVSDAYEALLYAVPQWEAEPTHDVSRASWLATEIRPRIVDAIRQREGRRFKKARFRQGMYDLDGTVGDDDSDLLLHEVVRDPSQHTYRAVAARLELERIASLPPRERDALVGDAGDVAREFGVDSSRVHQLRARARDRLGVRPVRSKEDLTAREFEVLEAAARGLSIVETAREFGVGVETVKTTRVNMMNRLGAKGIANAVHLGHLRGILGATLSAGGGEERGELGSVDGLAGEDGEPLL